MLKGLKAPLVAVLLSSVVLVPAATVTTFALTDVAHAKSEKAGGNGKAKGKSGNRGGAKSAALRSKGGNGKAKGKGGGLGGLILKLTGQERKAARSASASAKPAKGSGMHPSELGNMNGALNANMNAILAHIRNGNTNGPIGGMAALAVADSEAAGAEELIIRDDLFALIEGQLGEGGTIDGYYASVQAARDAARDPVLEDAFAALADDDPTNDAAAQATIDASAFDSEQSYLDSLDAAEAAARDPLVDGAIDELGGDSSTFTGLPEGVVDPTDEERLAAEEALDDLTDAELAMLELWNKNPDDTEEITDEEQALLDKLLARFEGQEDAIAEAIAASGAEDDALADGDPGECLEGEECVPGDEELAGLGE